MSETNVSESKASNLNCDSEPLPENISFFLIANSDQRQIHFGKLLLFSAVVFVSLLLLAKEIDLL